MTVLRFNKVGIKAISACVPQKKVSNYDLGHLFPSDYLDKLINSIGIEEKRIADEHVCASDLCFQAARKLMVDNHIEPESIDFFVILENFRLCLIQRTLEELPDFEVMTWQLCRMLRSALNCFQVTRFCVQK